MCGGRGNPSLSLLLSGDFHCHSGLAGTGQWCGARGRGLLVPCTAGDPLRLAQGCGHGSGLLGQPPLFMDVPTPHDQYPLLFSFPFHPCIKYTVSFSVFSQTAMSDDCLYNHEMKPNLQGSIYYFH